MPFKELLETISAIDSLIKLIEWCRAIFLWFQDMIGKECEAWELQHLAYIEALKKILDRVNISENRIIFAGS